MTDLLTELQCTKPPSSHCYRLIVLGSGRVGKTSIVRRFLYDDFSESYVPTIEDFHRKIYKIHNEVYQLDILDTSGIHPFPAMRRLSFLTGDAFILVYSVHSRESFEEALRLREQIIESIQAAATGSSKKDKQQGRTGAAPCMIPMIMAGNKCDKTGGAGSGSSNPHQSQQQVVPPAEVQHILQRFKERVAFIECSSKENVNIVELFQSLFILADLPDEMIPHAARRISLTHGGNRVLSNGPSNGTNNDTPLVTRHWQHAGLTGQMSLFARCRAELSRMLHSKEPHDAVSGGRHHHHGITLRRRLSDAYSALITNVRRPSIKADLIMVQEKREHSSSIMRNRGRNKKRTRKHELEREASCNTVDTTDGDEAGKWCLWRDKFCWAS